MNVVDPGQNAFIIHKKNKDSFVICALSLLASVVNYLYTNDKVL